MSEIKEPEVEGFVNVSIYIERDLLSLIDKIASEKKLNRSQLIRQAFGLYMKSIVEPPQAGIYVDAAGVQVHIGLLTEEGKAKVASGQWKLLKAF